MHSSYESFEEETRPLALVDGRVSSRPSRLRPVVLTLARAAAGLHRTSTDGTDGVPPHRRMRLGTTPKEAS